MLLSKISDRRLIGMPCFILLTIFVFQCAEAAEIPTPKRKQQVDTPFAINTQNKQDRPPASANALKKMTVADNFQLTLFAGDPDVHQPLAMCLDDRGRLWVVENYSYPEWKEEVYDRILIFEDTDNDGQFDKRKIFFEKGVHLTGIQLGFGGVWCTAAPYLIFIPDTNHDDIPDGAPQVMLAGFNIKEVGHNVVSGLMWGPDGWLYGRHGIKATSKVGVPGTKESERIELNCSIWRFHPSRKIFEVVVHGTTNPWGLDYDKHGEFFFTNNVNGYLWHAIPGAHFERMFGTHFNPHLYELMQKCADHQHWAGKHWADSRKKTGVPNPNDALGGGHSHCGGMIYQGGKWPQQFRGRMFTCNTHGKRVNQTKLERFNSGYVGKREPDFLQANSDWFRGIELKYAPDGDVYLTDWVDLGECHDHDGIHRTSGRIYKVIYNKQSPPLAENLATKTDLQLVKYLKHSNQWYARHARRILQERSSQGQNMQSVHQMLWNMFEGQSETSIKLQALWALHVTQGIKSQHWARLFSHQDEHIRVWTIRLSTDFGEVAQTIVKHLIAMAENEESSLVRLYLASTLRLLEYEDRWKIAQPLSMYQSDEEDKDFSLLLWYGIEPAIPHDANAAVSLLLSSKIKKLQQFIARRITSEIDQNTNAMNLLISALLKTKPEQQLKILSGVQAALQGRLKVAEPTRWNEVRELLNQSKNKQILQLVQSIAITFGDGVALDDLRNVMTNKDLSGEVRQQAIRTLVSVRADNLPDQLHQLINDRQVRTTAIRGLSAFRNTKTADLLLKHYRAFDRPDKQVALDVLASRVDFAQKLLTALEKKRVPISDLSSSQAQQIINLNDSQLKKRLENVWGTFQTTPSEKQQLISNLKKVLSKEYLKDASLSNGRLLFKSRCAVCHTLFDDGKQTAPNLTGSGRANIDYVLQNVITPSALVAADYRVWVFQLKSGRVLAGFISQQDQQRITIQSATEKIIIDRIEIEESKATNRSLMPDNLLKGLSQTDIRDFVGYLASPAQVDLPKGAKVVPLPLGEE